METELSVALYDVGGGVELRAIERGAGDTILFVHGWPTGAAIWKHQLEALSAEHRVIAIDLPGFGGSPPIAEPTVSAFAAVVKGFIDAAALSDVFLIGWSMGAGTVMSYCEQFGAHGLRALGIVDDCPCLLPGEGWELGVDTTFSPDGVDGWKERWADDRRSVITELSEMELKDPSRHSEELAFMVEESMKADPDGALAALMDAFGCDFRAGLPRISVPTLLLYGAFSEMTTAANRTYMTDTIPDATLEVFDESAHTLMLEEPEKFNRVVDEFARATQTG